MDDETARAILEAETTRLQAARAVVERERTEIQSERAMDPISDASLLEREIDESILHQVDAEIRAIEAARVRLSAGTYGRCEECGAPIDDDRLRAVPAALRCAVHQSKAEISLESRFVDGDDSPIDAAAASAWEASQNLDLVPSDDDADDEAEAPAAPEDEAMHVRDA